MKLIKLLMALGIPLMVGLLNLTIVSAAIQPVDYPELVIKNTVPTEGGPLGIGFFLRSYIYGFESIEFYRPNASEPELRFLNNFVYTYNSPIYITLNMPPGFGSYQLKVNMPLQVTFTLDWQYEPPSISAIIPPDVPNGSNIMAIYGRSFGGNASALQITLGNAGNPCRLVNYTVHPITKDHIIYCYPYVPDDQLYVPINIYLNNTLVSKILNPYFYYPSYKIFYQYIETPQVWDRTDEMASSSVYGGLKGRVGVVDSPRQWTILRRSITPVRERIWNAINCVYAMINGYPGERFFSVYQGSDHFIIGFDLSPLYSVLCNRLFVFDLTGWYYRNVFEADNPYIIEYIPVNQTQFTGNFIPCPITGGTALLQVDYYNLLMSKFDVRFNGNPVPTYTSMVYQGYIMVVLPPLKSYLNNTMVLYVDNVKQNTSLLYYYEYIQVTETTRVSLLGGTTTITGVNFDPNMSVFVDGVICKPTILAPLTKITCPVLAGTKQANMTLVTPTKTVTSYALRYAPIITNVTYISPLPMSGGGNVTVTGVNLGLDSKYIKASLNNVLSVPVTILQPNTVICFTFPYGVAPLSSLTITTNYQETNPYTLIFGNPSIGHIEQRGNKLDVYGSDFGSLSTIIRADFPGIGYETSVLSVDLTTINSIITVTLSNRAVNGYLNILVGDIQMRSPERLKLKPIISSVTLITPFIITIQSLFCAKVDSDLQPTQLQFYVNGLEVECIDMGYSNDLYNYQCSNGFINQDYSPYNGPLRVQIVNDNQASDIYTIQSQPTALLVSPVDYMSNSLSPITINGFNFYQTSAIDIISEDGGSWPCTNATTVSMNEMTCNMNVSIQKEPLGLQVTYNDVDFKGIIRYPGLIVYRTSYNGPQITQATQNGLVVTIYGNHFGTLIDKINITFADIVFSPTSLENNTITFIMNPQITRLSDTLQVIVNGTRRSNQFSFPFRPTLSFIRWEEVTPNTTYLTLQYLSGLDYVYNSYPLPIGCDVATLSIDLLPNVTYDILCDNPNLNSTYLLTCEPPTTNSIGPSFLTCLLPHSPSTSSMRCSITFGPTRVISNSIYYSTPYTAVAVSPTYYQRGDYITVLGNGFSPVYPLVVTVGGTYCTGSRYIDDKRIECFYQGMGGTGSNQTLDVTITKGEGAPLVHSSFSYLPDRNCFGSLYEGCKNGGVCDDITGHCNGCNANWYGEDCSIPLNLKTPVVPSPTHSIASSTQNGGFFYNYDIQLISIREIDEMGELVKEIPLNSSQSWNITGLEENSSRSVQVFTVEGSTFQFKLTIENNDTLLDDSPKSVIYDRQQDFLRFRYPELPDPTNQPVSFGYLMQLLQWNYTNENNQVQLILGIQVPSYTTYKNTTHTTKTRDNNGYVTYTPSTTTIEVITGSSTLSCRFSREIQLEQYQNRLTTNVSIISQILSKDLFSLQATITIPKYIKSASTNITFTIYPRPQYSSLDGRIADEPQSPISISDASSPSSGGLSLTKIAIIVSAVVMVVLSF